MPIDERETRNLIDSQLRKAGWEASSQGLRYAAGARPVRGRNQAIAEWPTAAGPADYVLFVGLTPIAAIEAKKENTDVSGSLEQAKRYARNLTLDSGLVSVQGPWGAYRVPFIFSTNARPYFRQMATRSGIWFCDVRQPSNLSHALEGWYTPEGLMALLSLDEEAAYAQLAAEPFSYGFPPRHYQREAIDAVENGLRGNQREMLQAMATGTGKTKTCIALAYRLLKAKRSWTVDMKTILTVATLLALLGTFVSGLGSIRPAYAGAGHVLGCSWGVITFNDNDDGSVWVEIYLDPGATLPDALKPLGPIQTGTVITIFATKDGTQVSNRTNGTTVPNLSGLLNSFYAANEKDHVNCPTRATDDRPRPGGLAVTQARAVATKAP